ncbi:MAG: class I SAM-dependent methyltransferase [Candidatus Dormibacteraceae bacterium]
MTDTKASGALGWRHTVNAAAFDFAMAVFERTMMPRARARLLGLARGDVLEVGAGTGANLSHYPAGCRLTISDREPVLLEAAARRAQRLGLEVVVERADAMALPFPNASFDSVVSTLTMCEVPDLATALPELARVCRPDGRILLLDHVRSPHRLVAKPQDWVTAMTATWGEHLNRDTLAAARAAGLRVVAARSWRLGIMLELVLSPLPGPSVAPVADCPG